MIGIKNNNPLNVKAPSDTYWNGQGGRDRFDHAIFADLAYGYRAALKNFRAYRFEHDRHTIADILTHWTHVAGHRPAYREFVLNAGVPGNVLDKLFDNDTQAISDPDLAVMLLTAMARFENGSNAWPEIESHGPAMRRAVEIYNEEYAGAPPPREFVTRPGDIIVTPSGDRFTVA